MMRSKGPFYQILLMKCTPWLNKKYATQETEYMFIVHMAREDVLAKSYYVSIKEAYVMVEAKRNVNIPESLLLNK